MTSEISFCITLATFISCITVSYFMYHEPNGFKRIYEKVTEVQQNKEMGLGWLAVLLFLLGVIVYQGYYYIAGTLVFYMLVFRLFCYFGKKIYSTK